jgi:hypothetical protein
VKFDGRAGNYVVRGSDANFNNQEFVADIRTKSRRILAVSKTSRQSIPLFVRLRLESHGVNARRAMTPQTAQQHER